MKKMQIVLVAVFFVVVTCGFAVAAPIKAYVAPFSVTGVQNRDELKPMLQTLLASRLNSDSVVAVENAAGADVTVNGSYIFFGGVYSLDVAVKDAAGRVITRAFEQGENQNEIIPVMKRLGASLEAKIAKSYEAILAQPSLPPAAAPRPTVSNDIVRTGQLGVQQTPQAREIVRPATIEKAAQSGWVSQRLPGTLLGIAPGRTLEGGEREMFIADNNSLRYYRQGKELKLIAEVAFSQDQEILAIDTIDLDKDGQPEIYLTIMSGETLTSQVWIAKGNKLEKLHDRLPYFFRVIALAGGDRKLYVQQIGRTDDFYGPVQELVMDGKGFATKNPIKLPRFGFLYNFNQFKDSTGALLTVVMNSNGFMIVYDQEGQELWRTDDKFGGSDVHFKRDDINNMKFTGSQYRWVFLDQRLTVSKNQEILVPKNSGSFVVGNQRTFKKSSVYDFVWNGSNLDEQWHTKEAQNYLADYFVDEAAKELVLLEVTRPDGVVDKGASVVAIKKFE